MWPLGIVVVDVDSERGLQMPLIQDEKPVQALGPHRPDPAFAGVEARAEADWIAEPPKVFRDHRTGNPELTWTVLLHSRPIELPSRTYHEVEVRGDGLVYRRGWIYWRLHESSEGLTSTHKKEDVEVWEQYTFSEGLPG
jgi:hypothetical protein